MGRSSTNFPKTEREVSDMSRKSIIPNIAYDTLRRSFYVTMRTRAQDGTVRRVTRCYPTMERAIQALDSFNAVRLLSQGSGTEKLSLGQWLSYWLDHVVAPSRSPSTTHGYTMIVRNHLSPALGRICLRELTAAQIQLYLRRKEAEGLSSNTVRKHLGVLHNALEQARRQNLISRNAAEQVTPPAPTRPDHHFYDPQTMSQLFEALAGTSMEPVVKLAGYLGLRRSEICGLKWSNVDRANKIITIAEARTAVNGHAVDKGTKNRSSIRRLGYQGLADLDEILERLWQQRQSDMARLGDAYADQDFVICHDGGLPYQPDYLSNRLQRVLKRTGLPYVTLHGLRHSFASIANSCNVSLFGISKALGHSSTNTTTQVYMHLFDETHLAIVQKVGKAIGSDEPL